MRIVQVVTLVSPTGLFGGPTRVATNQTAGLRAANHDARLAAGQLGYGDDVPSHVDGCEVALFPVHRVLPMTGLSGLASVGLLRWLRHELESADVAHIHLGRDLVTMSAAALTRRMGVPYVLQTHGMITPTSNPLAPPLDAVATRRLLRGATAVFYLTELERNQLEQVARAELSLIALPNGVPVPQQPEPMPARREVLYCSRLHRRKRPMAFVETARRLLAAGADADFVLVGPDDGEGEAVEAAITAVGRPDRLRWEGPLPPSETLDRIRRCSLFVLPSVDEPYPMAVIEAMSVARPVVITRSCGLADAVSTSGAGSVVTEDVGELVAAVGRLLAPATDLTKMGSNGWRLAQAQFAIESVVERLESVYEHARGPRSSAWSASDADVLQVLDERTPPHTEG